MSSPNLHLISNPNLVHRLLIGRLEMKQNIFGPLCPIRNAKENEFSAILGEFYMQKKD